jgi:hypothetical protein
LRDDVAKTGLTASGCPGRTPAPKLALVFPGERGTPFSGWSKAESALDAASGVSGWWLHDLRRTFATGLQRLGVRLEVLGVEARAWEREEDWGPAVSPFGWCELLSRVQGWPPVGWDYAGKLVNGSLQGSKTA